MASFARPLWLLQLHAVSTLCRRLYGPLCLERPAIDPDAHQTTYPCCGAFTHLGCLVQAARLHGRCLNCRAAMDHLPRQPSIATRCHDLGIDLDPVPARSCTQLCARCSAQLRNLALTPLNHRSLPTSVPFAVGALLGLLWASSNCQTTGCIGPLWLCTHCSNELGWERVQVPCPAPAHLRHATPMIWEVDMRQHSERWACGH